MVIGSSNWFIGCACDSKFVEPTAVMLTSLDTNGNIPEATIIVAGFDLTEEDRAVLRLGAGAMGDRIRFIAVTRAMLRDVDPSGFTDQYPLPILGRLFVAEQIDVPKARLLTLDSDMIVNASVRPLFELDLGEEFFAAIHDPPREDPNYFNSGLILVDVDTYKYYDVAGRTLRWLAAQEHQPQHPDQDALNDVVGYRWYRLDRTWNWFGYQPPGTTTAEYEGARIAHFPGHKPWDFAGHSGAPLYNRHLATLRLRRDRLHGAPGVDSRDFIATSYEVLLGRELHPLAILQERGGWPPRDLVEAVVSSPEFIAAVRQPIERNLPFPSNRFASPPTLRQRFWAADRLGVSREAAVRIERANEWRDLLSVVLGDPLFAATHGVAPLAAIADDPATPPPRGPEPGRRSPNWRWLLAAGKRSNR